MDKELFIEWERLVKNVRDFDSETSAYFHNAPYALQKCKDLLEFMKKEKVTLRDWCNRYLEENRQEIYVKFWVMMGWDILNQSNSGIRNLRFLPDTRKLHPEIFFYLERLGVKGDYQSAMESIKEIHGFHNPHHCHIPEILAIHEGIECDSNGWFCWNCDLLEDRWHDHLRKVCEEKEKENIFINKEARDRFIKEATDRQMAPDNWTPPFPSQEEVEPILLQTAGKTSSQLMKQVVKFASWQIQIWGSFRDDYKKFCEIWKFLEVLDSKLEVLEGALVEVEKFINS